MTSDVKYVMVIALDENEKRREKQDSLMT
jgi:hypothetical protein